MNRKSIIALTSVAFSIIAILSIHDVYAEVVSLTVDVQTILLEPGQVIPLLDTKSVGNMTKLQVSATLPCDGSHVPKLKIIAGALGNLTGVVDSSADYASLTGPFGTCFFSDTIAPKSNLPVLNKVFLKNDDSSSIITNLGTIVTLSGIIGNSTSSSQLSSQLPSCTGSNSTITVGAGGYDDQLGAGQTVRAIGTKVANANSPLYHKNILSVTFYIKKDSGAAGSLSALVYDGAHNLKHEFGIMDANSLTTSYVGYTFSSGNYTLQSGDYVVMDASSVTGNYIYLNTNSPSAYDGTNTFTGRYTTSWVDITDQDVEANYVYCN